MSLHPPVLVMSGPCPKPAGHHAGSPHHARPSMMPARATSHARVIDSTIALLCMMRMRRTPAIRSSRRALVMALLFACSSWPSSASAQAPGFAEITQPTAGSPLEGLVTIVGSANHPGFASYELSFAYAQDETLTWFPIAEAISTPVVNDRLAVWDTTAISDGAYALRLVVLLQDGSRLEAVVGELQVHNYTPSQTPPPRPSAGEATAVPTLAPTLTTTPPPVVPATQDPAAVVAGTLRMGALMGVAAILGLGALVLLRRAARWGRAVMPSRSERSERRVSRARRRKSRGGT